MFDNITGKFSGKFSGLFKRKKTRCVGVDIGSSSIKIVELEKKGGKIVLKNYALTEANVEGLIKPGSSNIISAEVGGIVEKILDDIGVKTKDINVAIPSFASLITTIELPPVSDKEIEQIIQVEAPKYIPVPLDEVVYGWEVIEDGRIEKGEQGKNSHLRKASKKKPTRVMLASIMKNISQEYEKVFKSSGYNIDSLEVDTFSLKRSIMGNEKRDCLIVDFGSYVTNISIIANGSVVINRSIDVGGVKMTELLSQSLGINSKRAEKIKNNQGLEIDSQDIKKQVMIPLLTNISDDIKKAMEVFKQNYPNSKLESLILTGGSSRMNGFKEFLSKELDINVVEGNPWKSLDYPAKLQESLDSLQPFFGTAVGLALRGLIEE
jgi:type IV pilus assembly protein PilM